MNAITVDSVAVDGDTVTATVDAEGPVRRFVTSEPFFVEYDVDVSDVHEGILSIPVLSQLCPVAWAAGADVHVPVVDSRFLDSLRTVGNVLCEMYPSFMEGGRVIAEESVDTGEFDGRRESGDSSGSSGAAGPATAPDAEDAPSSPGMLFTGGVDSLATYARHRDEDPTLINVKGWVIGIDDDETWADTKAQIEQYGDRFDAETQFVRSNMLEFLETPLLSAHYNDKHDGGWYSAVGGGLGMLGLCAPLTVAEDMETLYIGASMWQGMDVPPLLDHWEGRAMPWGSHPDIDDNVAWANTDAVHDAFELSRQGRIEVVADYVRETGDEIPVRSCEAFREGENCNRCEKCARTAIGLAIAGLDPNDHGFEVDRELFEHAQAQLAAGEWLATRHSGYYFEEFQRLLSADPDRDLPRVPDEFVDWLLDVDIAPLTGSPDRERLVRTAARQTPYPVYQTLYPAYQALQRRVAND